MKTIDVDVKKLRGAMKRLRFQCNESMERLNYRLDETETVLYSLEALLEDVQPFAAKASDIVEWRTRDNRVPEDTVQESFTAPYSDWRKLARWRKE